MGADAPTATIVIVSRDRRDELRRAIASALDQVGTLEVLVIDDGSVDGTAEMVAAEFPAVRLVRSERSEGLLAQRNRAARIATAPVIVSIDDDAVFPSERTVTQTVAEFVDPAVAVVAIPYVDVRYDETVRQRSPAPDDVFVTWRFIGTAHALRREPFLEVGGYREALEGYFEEEDLTLRLLDRGYVVRLGAADPIHHVESSRRNWSRMRFRLRRNAVFSALMTAPLRLLPMHLAWLAGNTIHAAVVERQGIAPVFGMLSGVYRGWCYRHERRAVRAPVFSLRQRLWRVGPVPLSLIQSTVGVRARPTQVNRLP